MSFTVTRRKVGVQEKPDGALPAANEPIAAQANGLNDFSMNGSGGLMAMFSALIKMLTSGNLFAAMGASFGNLGGDLSSGYTDFTDAFNGRGDTPLGQKGVQQNLGFGNRVGTSLRGVLDLIGKHESGGDYNRVYSNGKDIKRVDLTNMTIDQVQAWQKQYVRDGSPSSAAGKYQIIPKTLAGLEKQMGLTGKEKFDVEMQDRMALQLLKNRGIDQFAAGKMTTGQILNEIAKEWASIETTAGKSYYAGDGLNSAPKGTGKQMVAELQGAFKTDSPERTSVARKVDTAVDASNDAVYNKPSKTASPKTAMTQVAAAGQEAKNDSVADRKMVGNMFVGNYDGSDAAKPTMLSLTPVADLNRVTFPTPNKV